MPLPRACTAVRGRAEGAVKSNVRRALDSGVSPEAARHVVAPTISTRGFPATVAVFGWAEELLATR